MPAAIATKTSASAGRIRAGIARPARMPMAAAGRGVLRGSSIIAASPQSAASPPQTNTGAVPKCAASQGPSGNATIAGTPDATP